MNRKSWRTRACSALLLVPVSILAVALVSASAMAQTAQSVAPVDSASPVQPTQEWGSFGVRTEGMDPAVKPGDDFNLHVNGTWIARTDLPADRTRFGSFDQLDELSKTRLKAILDEVSTGNPAPGTPEARIAAAYKAFMDADAIEAAGLAPARPWLDRIFAARSRDDLIDLFAMPGIASPIASDIDIDPRQTDRVVLNLAQGGLGLPDRDYYLLDTPRYGEIRAKYRDFLAFLLGQAGYADPQGAAQSVLALETDLARAQWDRATSRNRQLTYNRLSAAEVQALPHGNLLARYAAGLGGGGLGAGGQPYLLVAEMPPSPAKLAEAKVVPAAAAKLGGGMPATLRIVAEAPLATWQAWLAARFLSDHAAVLPRAIDEANFAFNSKVLMGQPEQKPRWKRGIEAVEGQAGELLGQIYVARHFPPENKAAMDALVGNLRKALAASLADLRWMGPKTRAEAQAKLDAFTPKIAYPDRFKAYEGLDLAPDKPLANVIAGSDWAWKQRAAKLGKPVDRSEWFMLPQVVNAYYNPNFNEIVFPAAILQPPFFNLSADPAVNYGGIGAVIGHEIGHGFDDQGSESDGTGMLREWWTPQDKVRFKALQDRLGAQFAAYCPLDEGKSCINPALTMGENIGDLGGLSLAYRAYRMSLNGKEAPVIDGFTGDQRFFMGWAQVWRNKTREERARQLLVIDPHAPAAYRINGIVRNFDEWYAAFGVKPGDALYLPPEKRVRIW